MKKDKKPEKLDSLAVIVTHTQKQTLQLYDGPGPEGRVGENSNGTHIQPKPSAVQNILTKILHVGDKESLDRCG